MQDSAQQLTILWEGYGKDRHSPQLATHQKLTGLLA